LATGFYMDQPIGSAFNSIAHVRYSPAFTRSFQQAIRNEAKPIEPPFSRVLDVFRRHLANRDRRHTHP
jgi:hypothetical protein